MKIEISVGKKTKKKELSNIPWSKDLVVKIDGKQMQGVLNYFFFCATAASGPVQWEMGLKSKIKVFDYLRCTMAILRWKIKTYFQPVR